MIICIDCRSLSGSPRTGVGQVLMHVVTGLIQDYPEHTYYVLTTGVKKPDLPSTWVGPHVHHVHASIPNKLLHLSLVLFQRPYIDSFLPEKVDWIILPNLHFTAVSKNITSLQIVHDLSFVVEPRWYSWSRRIWHQLVQPRQQCQKATLLVVPSNQTKQDLIRWFGIDQHKIFVVPWGVDEAYSDSILQNKTITNIYNLPEQYVLFLGTIEPRKNVLAAIEAYELSGLREKGIQFVIAGSRGWTSDHVHQKIEETEGVTYIGYVAEEDKPALYHQAQLFIYPSFYEGFGLPPLEALATGTPVIMGPSPGLIETVGDLVTLVSVRDVKEMAEAMRLVIERENKNDSYVIPSWKKSVEAIQDLLKKSL